MGIFFFLFFYLFSATGGSQSYKNASYLDRYTFFTGTSSVPSAKLNFFKKKNGLRFFFRKFKNAHVVFFYKNLFVTSTLVLNFFNACAFFRSLTFFFCKKLHVEKVLATVLVILAADRCVAPRSAAYANFAKIFDFFFKKSFFILSKLETPHVVAPKTAALAVDEFHDDEEFTVPAYGHFLKKFNLYTSAPKSVLETPANGAPNYLFLVNNFFSTTKKFFFLRNNELYNKSRYSRNRQTYRTGVFWCIWLTVLTVIGLYFYFYVFLIKFTYVWFFFFLFILSFFLFYFRSKVERHFFF